MIMGQLLPQHPLTFVILCFVRVRHKHGIAFWTFVSMEDLKMTLPVGPEALCEIASLVTTKFFVRPPRGLNVGERCYKAMWQCMVSSLVSEKLHGGIPMDD